MSSTKQVIALVAASLLVLLFGLLGLELVFGGWLRGDSWSEVDKLNVVRGRSTEYDVRRIYGPDAAPVRYTRDRYGLRGSCDDPAQVRLVTLGGSTTDQVYVSDGQTWQDRLQSRMTQAHSGRTWCVSNAGVDGHSSFGHIAALERWLPLVPGLKPDYVLLYVGVNDAALRTERAPSDLRADEPAGRLARLKRAVNENSALLHLIRRALAARADAPLFAAHKLIFPTDSDYTSTAPAADIAPLVAASSEAFRERLRRLLQLIEARGAKPVCVSQPSLIYRRYGDAWRGIPDVFTHQGRKFNGLDYRLAILSINAVMAQECPAAGGHYIDLEGAGFEPAHFYDCVHMNASGAARVGDLLADAFSQQGIGGLRPLATSSRP
ncbi:MAG: SGNH/GDSL hydrolase family protein [Piscinibacter sp.]|uniref:SGNH/GDSL hydrolase family protein n=1 Tax=Piscinibacter sp. TaxID=1903157 RepID=UPI003D1350A6